MTSHPSRPSRTWYLAALILILFGLYQGFTTLHKSVSWMFDEQIHFSTKTTSDADNREITTLKMPFVRFQITQHQTDKNTDQPILQTLHMDIEETTNRPAEAADIHHHIGLFFEGAFWMVSGLISGLMLWLIIFIKRSPPACSPQSASSSTPLSNEQPGSTWALFCHLSALSGYCIPFFNILVPLFLWVLKRHEDGFIDAHGKEALNFQLSMSLYAVLATLAIFLLIGLFILPFLAIFNVIMILIAAIDAGRGYPFRYPMSIRFIR